MSQTDAEVMLWMNGLAGKISIFDDIVKVVASDYLVPVVMSLVLVGLWFIGNYAWVRERHQKTVLVATSAIGLASLIVFVINTMYFRERPFVNYEVSLLFYEPTDSSFPANPVAVIFAVAASVWGLSKKVGIALYLLAIMFASSRVYVGVFFPMDVAGGAAIGIVAAFLMSRLIRLLEPIPTVVIMLARRVYLA